MLCSWLWFGGVGGFVVFVLMCLCSEICWLFVLSCFMILVSVLLVCYLLKWWW